MALLGNVKVRLKWVKAHIGIRGNEMNAALAKEATSDGSLIDLPDPKSFLKNQLMMLSLDRWQVQWDNGEIVRSIYSIVPKICNKQLHWSRECIQFATGLPPVI
ncbi:hypothetical protein AVEN_75312-1 [Araneus ventricosus]|uniref:RNase H type-1 domain-containing protein n=1 Tax=Araneus ventricosus TaxID=182803 RepID=A0A4Y2G3S9_ARAVE|nr:hypothetical protein AVEN_75312-1 [Araneus ventricosus]